jgi:hypothetical protein
VRRHEPGGRPTPGHPVTALWQVIRGEAPGRRSDEQITLFDSVGFATEDFSALRYVRDKLKDTGFYEKLDLLADPDEPRDLYGMLLRHEPICQRQVDGSRHRRRLLRQCLTMQFRELTPPRLERRRQRAEHVRLRGVQCMQQLQ